MTSIADTVGPSRGARWFRAVAGAVALAFGALSSPMPWAVLWLLVPVAVASSLLIAWRFGAWGFVLPALLSAAAVALAFALRGGVSSAWVWWTPVAAMTGVWMGLREEGGGPDAGRKAWMLVPGLLLASSLPLMPGWSNAIGRLDGELRGYDRQVVELARDAGWPADRLATFEKVVDENAGLRRKVMPFLVPVMLFGWMGLMVTAGRGLAARGASLLRWPSLSRSAFTAWRLPDGALAVLIAGLGLALLAPEAWHPTAWTLLAGAALGFCLQGIAVVESLLSSRGVPATVIVVTLLFMLLIATPVFLLSSAVLGLSDVWLDYRRLEPSSKEGA